MKKLPLILGIAATAVVSTGLALTVRADRRDVRLHAELRGLNEVPPTASRGQASLRATLDEDAQSITFTLDFKDLSGPPSAAHIHFGPPRVNGGVMVFFCGGGGKPACPSATSPTWRAPSSPATATPTCTAPSSRPARSAARCSARAGTARMTTTTIATTERLDRRPTARFTP
jgi:hypothetical protein